MEGMSVQAQEARQDYKRQYRIRNQEKINRQQRAWRKANPDKVKEYQARYWERKAEKAKCIRASWQDYGITPERLDELIQVVRSEECDELVLQMAHMADEKAARHIILSVKKNLSYERLEYHDQLGRCPLGRTDFYGARRLFFHYLDCTFKEMQRENRVEDPIYKQV